MAQRRIVTRESGLIPACDVPFARCKRLFEATKDVEKISAYKLGVSVLDVGLKTVVKAVKETTNKPAIYDHQKAGSDIPESTPQEFMDCMVRAGMDAVILVPQAGPVTEYEWILAAQERKLGVIVGGEMTHLRYLEGDFSEGKEKNYTGIFEGLGIPFPLSGFIRRSAPDLMYIIAARMGVENFVVPGNKPDRILHYKKLVMEWGARNPTFFSPGFITQDGSISAGAKAAGRRFHPIVGRALNDAKDIREAALILTRELAD